MVVVFSKQNTQPNESRTGPLKKKTKKNIVSGTKSEGAENAQTSPCLITAQDYNYYFRNIRQLCACSNDLFSSCIAVHVYTHPDQIILFSVHANRGFGIHDPLGFALTGKFSVCKHSYSLKLAKAFMEVVRHHKTLSR